MRRIFEIDVLECPECGGAMRILECLDTPSRSPADGQRLSAQPPGAPSPLGTPEVGPWVDVRSKLSDAELRWYLAEARKEALFSLAAHAERHPRQRSSESVDHGTDSTPAP